MIRQLRHPRVVRDDGREIRRAFFGAPAHRLRRARRRFFAERHRLELAVVHAPVRRDLPTKIFAGLTRRASRKHVAQMSSRDAELLRKLGLCAARSACELLSQPCEYVLFDPLDALLLADAAVALLGETPYAVGLATKP